jgi:hypothetical protein
VHLRGGDVTGLDIEPTVTVRRRLRLRCPVKNDGAPCGSVGLAFLRSLSFAFLSELKLIWDFRREGMCWKGIDAGAQRLTAGWPDCLFVQ